MEPTGNTDSVTGRYRSRTVTIGRLGMGGDSPVRIQSMANTDTRDVEATTAQCMGMVKAGADLVRCTVQGRKELVALREIRHRLHASGVYVPVVADIHFNPKLAVEAARVADKIRINPGNYLKGRTAASRLPSLIQTCREEGTAIRIGVNHGSLDDAILHEYGNSPQGMVASAMPFLRVCSEMAFEPVVVSMKSSNPVVTINAVRLLVSGMKAEGMQYPLHLGVTEAGNGMEGRIRSAVGIAPLLLEGMGDTIRVSLTEPPESEVPVAAEIVRLFPKPGRLPYDPLAPAGWDPFSFRRRNSWPIKPSAGTPAVGIVSTNPPDRELDLLPGEAQKAAVGFDVWSREPGLLENRDRYMLLDRGTGPLQETKHRLSQFCSSNLHTPVVYRTVSRNRNREQYAMELAGELGFMLAEGQIDGVWAVNPHMEAGWNDGILLKILQAAGARASQAEYIACPSCGRTHFDIVSRLNEIRQATSHLKSLKIAVMGCIVNGPGEMADAHYGYVGAGPGKVTIYRGKEPRRRQIPESRALHELIGLMKEEGDWIDP